MCCIFTYMSWIFDFIQRVWSFIMSCCIGGAVCVLFLVAVVSGIAFGYHYSISEFLKYNDSLLSITLRRDISEPLDGETWWPDDPNGYFNRKGRKQFLAPTTDEDYGGVVSEDTTTEDTTTEDTTTEDTTTTESTTTTKKIVTKKLVFAITTKKFTLKDVLKQRSVNQMKAEMDHIYKVDKARKKSRTTQKRTSVTYRRLSSKRKTVKPFEYISDYEDLLMTARTFTPIALFAEYDENEIDNWRRVAQSMLYDYPESHDAETRPKEEAYPIYDSGAGRKDYTGRRKKFKHAHYFIDPSFGTMSVTRNYDIDSTKTKIKSKKRLKYIFTSTPFKVEKTTKVTEGKESLFEKDERDNKTQEYLSKVLVRYGR